MTGDGVLVVGESLMDIVTDGTGRTTEVVGGSPANVALGLARQQVPVRLLTALGRDARGARIRDRLAADGVDVLDASWSLEATSTAHARISADGSADYVFDITWTLPASDALGDAGLVHIGSIGAFLEPGATTLEGWLARRERETLITFDPNIRPALLADRPAAVARFERLAAMSEVVKLSDEDAGWLFPGLSPAQVLERISGLGARLAALTMGGAGALLRAGEVEVGSAAPAVAVRDTVGAGDTFMAALIHRVLADPGLLASPTPSSVAAAASYAVAAAAITVQRVGADLPTAAEIAEGAL
jgi:fructokinase